MTDQSSPKWEPVSRDELELNALDRHPVPGGWIYRVTSISPRLAPNVALVFVPAMIAVSSEKPNFDLAQFAGHLMEPDELLKSLPLREVMGDEPYTFSSTFAIQPDDLLKEDGDGT